MSLPGMQTRKLLLIFAQPDPAKRLLWDHNRATGMHVALDAYTNTLVMVQKESEILFSWCVWGQGLKDSFTYWGYESILWQAKAAAEAAQTLGKDYLRYRVGSWVGASPDLKEIQSEAGTSH
jgi:hypothetical protein